MSPTRQLARKIAGIFCLFLGIIGLILPIVPGFVFLGLAVALLGTDSGFARWVRKMKRYLRGTTSRFSND